MNQYIIPSQPCSNPPKIGTERIVLLCFYYVYFVFEQGREGISVAPSTASRFALLLIERTKVGHANAVPPCICMGAVAQAINVLAQGKGRSECGTRVSTCLAHKNWACSRRTPMHLHGGGGPRDQWFLGREGRNQRGPLYHYGGSVATCRAHKNWAC